MTFARRSINKHLPLFPKINTNTQHCIQLHKGERAHIPTAVKPARPIKISKGNMHTAHLLLYLNICTFMRPIYFHTLPSLETTPLLPRAKGQHRTGWRLLLSIQTLPAPPTFQFSTFSTSNPKEGLTQCPLFSHHPPTQKPWARLVKSSQNTI